MTDKKKTGNGQPRSKAGKFLPKQPSLKTVDNTDLKTMFINEVKNELYAGYNDTDRITKAYNLITGGNELANIRVMKTAIISYNNQN